MTRLLQAAVAAIAMLGFAAPEAAAQRNVQLGDIQITSLTVQVVEDTGSFEVIDSRMDETATAAVFFGMIGAVANSAVNNAEDDEKADPLRPTAAEIDLDGLIARAINERLASRDTVTMAATAEDASHTVRVEIGDWGLIRRAQRPDTSMRAFLKLNISVLDARGRRIYGPQRENSIGQFSGQLHEFTPELFRTEMEDLAARAGQQVANRIIYR